MIHPSPAVSLRFARCCYLDSSIIWSSVCNIQSVCHFLACIRTVPSSLMLCHPSIYILLKTQPRPCLLWKASWGSIDDNASQPCHLFPRPQHFSIRIKCPPLICVHITILHYVFYCSPPPTTKDVNFPRSEQQALILSCWYRQVNSSDQLGCMSSACPLTFTFYPSPT